VTCFARARANTFEIVRGKKYRLRFFAADGRERSVTFHGKKAEADAERHRLVSVERRSRGQAPTSSPPKPRATTEPSVPSLTSGSGGVPL